LHTDTTYFSDPIKLQLFHLLSDRSTHTGGHSTLADGFLCARTLKASHPILYDLLCTLPVPAHASGGDHTLVRPCIDRPIFELDHDGELLMIRYNADDRGIIGRGHQWQGTVTLEDGRTVSKVTAFYAALKVWESLLRSPEYCYEFPMEPGTPFVFDNQRVLHGRTGFSGSRRLCGACACRLV
jgi:trimethyllysine dioxygenase